MSEPAYVHIVDPDISRRARIARQLYERHIHAEIYDSLDELTDYGAKFGAVLISDDGPSSEQDAALKRAQQAAGYLPIACYSSKPSTDKVVSAMTSGALDYLEWPCPTDALVRTLRKVSALGDQRAQTEKRKVEARRKVAKLTGREMEVLRILIAGASNKGVASELGISPRTVEIHRSNLMGALGAQSIADAVRIGIYAGLDG